jgi:hypothetical protein
MFPVVGAMIANPYFSLAAIGRFKSIGICTHGGAVGRVTVVEPAIVHGAVVLLIPPGLCQI